MIKKTYYWNGSHYTLCWRCEWIDFDENECVCVYVSRSVEFNSLWPHGLSMGFSRQECWSGLPFSSPENGDREADNLKVTEVKLKLLSCVWLFATPGTVAHQAPRPMEFFQARILECVAIPFPRNLSHPGIEPKSPALQADSSLSEPSDTFHRSESSK